MARSSLKILGVGDAKSRHFARWATRLAERGHEVHARFGDPTAQLEGVYREVLGR